MSIENRVWQGIPGIERSAGGRLFVAWFTGGTHEPQPENTVVLAYSDNDGHGFCPLQAMALPQKGARTFDPTLWLDPLKRLWLIFNRGNPTSGLHGVYARICETPDAAVPEWGAEFRLGFDEVALSFRMNKPTVLSSGEWVLPVTHAVAKTFDWFARERQRQGVAISTDHGKTWTLHGDLEAPPWALENMIVEKRDGRLWMLIRTGSGFLWESISVDRGRTWSAAAQSTIANPGSRFFIRRLASGNLLLVNHFRNTPTGHWVGRNHLTAQLSVDDGETWNDGLLLDERDNISYPDGVEAPDGLIRIIYDRDRKGDGDILMATFREDDVAAGDNVSGAVTRRIPLDTLRAVRIGADPLSSRTILGLGVETEPPLFLFRDTAVLSDPVIDEIVAVAERRLRLLRPAIARIFCFPEQWNPSLDGETFGWDDPGFKRHVRMLAFLQELGCRVNLVLFSPFTEPYAVKEKTVLAMVAMLVHVRREHGFNHIDWLTLFNEPESIFRQDTPLAHAIFGEKPALHTWEQYVTLNRLAMKLLAAHGLDGIRMAMPDSAWGGQMRKERMALTAAAFPSDDINFSYHHYNPDDPDFNRKAPPAFHYHGMREEVERFRKLAGPDRQLVIWEFNNVGDGFGSHHPGTDVQGRNVLEVPEAGAKLANRILQALCFGVDGLCLWHMHDSDVNKFGLWRNRADGFAMKPYWHYYALLCRTFRPGQGVLPATALPAPVALLATRDGGGRLRVAVLNDCDQATSVALDLPTGGNMRLQRLDPTVLPPPEVEEPFCEESETDAGGRLRLELKPWELVVMSGE